MAVFFQESLFTGVTLSLVAYMVGVFLKKKFKSGIFNPLLISMIITIVVAIPLYEQWELLRKNYKAVMLGLLAGVVTSLCTVLVLCYVLKLSHEEYVTLLPKSITTAIGMGVSEELGGYVTITVAVIVVTGVIGNILGELICKVFKIEEPISKGLALGCSAHAIGTAKAIEMGEKEGAMSGLAIAVSGILTVVMAPLFANFL